jgi:hypothetical protein
MKKETESESVTGGGQMEREIDSIMRQVSPRVLEYINNKRAAEIVDELLRHQNGTCDRDYCSWCRHLP